jgi:RNA polymerase sigma-70 factor (ECF subfamily)
LRGRIAYLLPRKDLSAWFESSLDRGHDRLVGSRGWARFANDLQRTRDGMGEPVGRNPQAAPEDEADLVRSAQGGDARAFAELVRRYQRAVYRVAHGLTRNPSDADDVAQETFVRAYQALGRFRVGEPLYPWLARITINLAFSLHRRRRRRPEAPLEPLLEAGRQWGVEDDPGERLDQEERRRRLLGALAKLRPEHQAVLVLRVTQDLSYDEIAKALSVPIGTVMSRLARARAELRRRLETGAGESR